MRTHPSRYPRQPEYPTSIITAGGWARSGKGTSMAHLKGRLEETGLSVRLIDQGLKFRVIGELAVLNGKVLDSPADLDSFVRSPRTRQATLKNLDEVYALDEENRKKRLYTPQMSKVSGKVARVSGSHEIAVGLLREEVETAVDAQTRVVLIDGRSMEKYAK